MKRTLVLPAAFLAAVVVAVGFPSAGLAAPPANDDFDSATVIASLPFDEAIDTSEATVAPDDPYCVGQSATVWYVLTPPSDVRIGADTFGSNYDTTLSVYTGARGALTQIACNDDSQGLQSQVAFDAEAGVTYYIMVGAYGSGPGGSLDLSVYELPPFEFDLQVDPTGSVDPKTGVATVHGMVVCSQPLPWVDLYGEVTQRIGRTTIAGSFYVFQECIPPGMSWSVDVASPNGLYVGGHAEVTAWAFTCEPFGCHQEFESLSVRLIGKK